MNKSIDTVWKLFSFHRITSMELHDKDIFSCRYKYRRHCVRWCNMLTQWASYQIRKIACCACAGNAGNVFPRRRFQMKPLVSDPGMHPGTCVTHVPWCTSGSLTCGDGENVPGIPGACAPAILRIWQEAHCRSCRCVRTLFMAEQTVVYRHNLVSILPQRIIETDLTFYIKITVPCGNISQLRDTSIIYVGRWMDYVWIYQQRLREWGEK